MFVTVIIPAYNAERTLASTVASALAQSHSDLEVVVVDDGSTDGTRDLAHQLARDDSRVRIVAQANMGLASARNSGIAAARGQFIAPLDADDLWHPEKLARQLAALAAVPGAAMAYAWFRNIDPQDRVLPGSGAPVAEGHVFFRHLDENFVSNGSSPLVRAEVARAIRYDPALALGCEDYMFQLQVARRYPVACARAWLTGYRRTPGSMSTGVLRMIDAHLQMFALLRGTAGPEADRIIAGRVARLQVERARNRIRRGRAGEAAAALARALAGDPAAAAGEMAAQAATALKRTRGGMFPPPARPFLSYAVDEPDGPWNSGRRPERDRWLAELEAPSG